MSGTFYRYLIDTNILVYAHDSSLMVQQTRAIELLSRLQVKGNAAFPAQVLAEFANVALRKLTPSIDFNIILQQVKAIALSFTVLPLTTEIVIEALLAVDQHSFSYYDAQIWAVARIYHIPIVLSEDFNSGATIRDVTFLNPFDTSFDLMTIQ